MEASSKEKGWLDWIDRTGAHPRILFTGFVVTIVALVVMVVLFFVSQEESKLVYVVNPVKTKIVTGQQTKELEILYRGEKLGDVDITAVQVAIWNAGDKSIRMENVIKEVVICTGGDVPVLEASVVKYQRDVDVTGFTLVDSSEQRSRGRVPVRWNILEQNDGASIQLIYVGGPEIDVIVEGLIEGRGEVKRLVSGLTVKTPAQQVRSEQKIRWLAYPYLFLSVVAMFIGIWRVTRHRDIPPRISTLAMRKQRANMRKNMGYLLIGMGAMMGGWSVWVLIRYGIAGPPFGF